MRFRRLVEIRAEDEEQMSELEPRPELPDNMPIRDVRFPAQVRDALFAAGLKTVGQVREISDAALLALPDFETASIAYLRETLGVATGGVSVSCGEGRNDKDTGRV